MEKIALYRFFAGLSSDAEKEAIKLWLEEDVANREILLRERAFYDAVMLADERRFATKEPFIFRNRKMIGQAMKWIAVILLAFISSYWFFHAKYCALESAINTVSVPPGQYVNLLLSDGTKVYLNAGSTFTYPSSFAGDARKVQLSGEAFFEVASNERKPFIVHTHVCDVEVLGTKFNVDAYDGEIPFSVALMEGCIKVRDITRPENAICLSPNHKVTFSDGKLSVSDISDYGVYRWKEGLICFENLNFADLLKRLEKFYGIELVMENPSLNRYSFSGKFRTSDGIDNLLRVLQKDIGYRYTRSEDGNVIYLK